MLTDDRTAVLLGELSWTVGFAADYECRLETASNDGSEKTFAEIKSDLIWQVPVLTLDAYYTEYNPFSMWWRYINN